MSTRYATLILLTVVLAVPFQAHSEEQHVCHRSLETTFVKEALIQGCKIGDILVLQLTSNIAPAPLVGKYCDFTQSIFSEIHGNQVTIACVFAGSREQRRLIQ